MVATGTAEARVVILYGSQTGQSQAIAEDIAARLHEQQPELCVKVHVLNDIGSTFDLAELSHAIIIISSTGDGDVPDNANRFFRKLHRSEDNLLLSNLKFALLGLGDTNYSSFGACPRKLEKLLLGLQAQPFYPTGLCDDAVGLEIVAEPWIEGLLSVFSQSKQMQIPVMNSSSGALLTPDVKISSDETAIAALLQDAKLSDVCGVTREALPVNSASASPLEECCSLMRVSACKCQWPMDSIRSSATNAIVPVELRIPVLPDAYLRFDALDVSGDQEAVQSPASMSLSFSSMASSIIEASVESIRCLTCGDVKPKYEIIVNVAGIDESFQAGDAFYFIAPNASDEVDWLLERLNVSPALAKAVMKCSVDPQTKKANAAVPLHLDGFVSFRLLLENVFDFRKTPTRALLRTLAEYTTGPEKDRLLLLSSTEGMSEYQKYVREPQLSLLDVLHAFPTCAPPIERLCEQLPRLLPRAYSLACSPNDTKKPLARFAFSLVEFGPAAGRFYGRFGVCSGWLKHLSIGSKVKMFLKKASSFRLPPNLVTSHLILIGPGTGVAPFLGFLEQLKLFVSCEELQKAKRMLFFGCRHEEKDFIYQDELKGFVRDGVLSDLIVAFSRDEDAICHSGVKYVQDGVRQRSCEIAEMLKRDDCFVYVCGDAKNMSNDVFKAFLDVLKMPENGGLDDKDAADFLSKLRSQGRYLQDIWR